MKIRPTRFQVLTLLLLVASLLLPALGHAVRIQGEGTFTDLKGPPVDAGPAPVLKSVVLRIPGSSEGPGLPWCETDTVQPNGVCEVNLADFPEFTVCDHYVAFFVFLMDPVAPPGDRIPPLQAFDVTCVTDITIVFTGIFSGPTILHDTFTVYGDGSGGYFMGPAICECTFTNPFDGTVLGPGRVDFVRNIGTFGPDFFGSGSFEINRAYGAVTGVRGQGVFRGTIGQQGEYKAIINFPNPPQ